MSMEDAHVGAAEDACPLVLVAVGTDHHPFDRLIRWVDGWLARQGSRGVRCFVQCGTADPPRHAPWSDVVPHERFQALLDAATAVVCHGGPGIIMEARRRGLTPIVVPRRPELGEHVDDHQIRFARWMATRGLVICAETPERLAEAIEASIGSAGGRRPEPEPPPEGVRRFADVVRPLTHERADATRVLYIGGWGRSGSTLLARLLGEFPGYLPVGELREGWLRGCRENRLCGCGEPFLSCPFWSEVGLRAFGGWGSVPVEDLLRAWRRYDRPWMVPLLSMARRIPRPGALDLLIQALADLYAAAREVSGARVVVDSSKLPSYGFLLRLVPGLDVRMVHLVRDPRGVAFSWMKRLVRPDGAGRGDQMPRFDPLAAAIRYDVYNAQAHLARHLGIPYLRIRYEDLVADPQESLRRIVAFMGEPPDTPLPPSVSGSAADLGVAHTVDGNPMRLSRGTVSIRADEAWKSLLGPRERRIVTAVTFPLLRLYGYPSGVRRAPLGHAS